MIKPILDKDGKYSITFSYQSDDPADQHITLDSDDLHEWMLDEVTGAVREFVRDPPDLALMSDLSNNDKNEAKSGKIYLAEDGSYIFRGKNDEVNEGKLNSNIDLSNLKQKLTDHNFKKSILNCISDAGHTLPDSNNYSLQLDGIPSPKLFATYRFRFTVKNGDKQEYTYVCDPNNQEKLTDYRLNLKDHGEHKSIKPQETSYILSQTTLPDWASVKPTFSSIKGTVTHQLVKDESITRATLPDRDVWVYKPAGFKEGGKIIFMLDGKDMCERLVPYIDAQGEPSNTAIVFINPGDYGCDLHIMPTEPQDITSYIGCYLWVGEKQLLYVNSDGTTINTIKDADKFKIDLQTINPTKLAQVHLSSDQIKEFITSNGKHSPPVAPGRVREFYLDKRKDFVDLLSNQLIPKYVEELKIPNAESVILVAHSLAAFPMIDVAKTNPEKVGGLILVSPALNQEQDRGEELFPGNASPAFKKLPLVMQKGNEQKQPPLAHQRDQGMTEESRADAIQKEGDALTDKNGKNYEHVKLIDNVSGHDSINVLSAMKKGLPFIHECSSQADMKNSNKSEESNSWSPLTTLSDTSTCIARCKDLKRKFNDFRKETEQKPNIEPISSSTPKPSVEDSSNVPSPFSTTPNLKPH
jgi:predicted alpha/beta superfamily hydrolase